MKPPITLPNPSKNTPSTVYKTCTITGKHHIPSSTLSTPFWLPPAPTISKKTNSKAFKISTLRHMSKNKKSSTKENSLSKIKSRERSKNSLPIFSKGQISLTVYQLTWESRATSFKTLFWKFKSRGTPWNTQCVPALPSALNSWNCKRSEGQLTISTRLKSRL